MCPVCGFDSLSGPPYEQYGDPVPFGSHGELLEVGCPTHVICPSCRFHYGYDDELDPIFHRWREEWSPLAAGWDPIAQLRRVGRGVTSDL